jgi:hypothetical protein
MPVLTILVAAAMSVAVGAQSGGDKMDKSISTEKTYTGCVEAGSAAGSFTLTHVTADTGKDTVKKDSMGKDAMAPSTLTIAGTEVDLSKHVGHKVSVTGAEDKRETEKSVAVAKGIPAFTVQSLRMIATSCEM